MTIEQFTAPVIALQRCMVTVTCRLGRLRDTSGIFALNEWKHFLSDVSDVADQTGTVRGSITRAEMSLKTDFHILVTVIVSICRRLIGDTSPMCRSRLPTFLIIWKPGLKISLKWPYEA